MSEVLVSVIMPVFNCEKYIAEAIDSILSQSYRNLEFIIINDGSSDNTDGVIKGFSDSRIKYFSEKINRGIVYALNKGIEESNGDYIIRMDADDIALPDRITEQITFLDLNTNIDILGSKAIFFEDKNHSKTTIHGSLLNSHKVIKALLFFCSPYVHPTIVFRNALKNKPFLYYSYDSNYGDDYELFTRNIDNFIFGFLDKNVLKYRVHNSENRLTSTNKKFLYKSSTLKTRLAYFNKHFPDFNPKLVIHYEDLFYGDVNISLQSSKKTILFYLRTNEKILEQNYTNPEREFITRQVNLLFYNSFYRYSRIGFKVFHLYCKYSKKLGYFRLHYKIKFLIKCLMKK